jgi:hypothetical protein
MDDVRKQVDAIPRVKLRHRLSDYHCPLGCPRTEDMRLWNIGRIEEEMKRDEQVSLTFAALESALQRGEQVPISNPLQYDEGGDWELFSSEVFTKYLLHDIDNLEFKNWEVNRTMHFHDPAMTREQVQQACWCKYHIVEGFGHINAPREPKGLFKPFDWPQYASLDPIVVKTTSRSREMKMWFAGQGCMRMQCVVGSKADIENGDAETIVWSGVHMTEARKDEEMAVFQEKLKKKLEAAERLKEEVQKAEERTRKTEEERRVWQEEVGGRLLAVEEKREEWLERDYNGEVGSDDMLEELPEEEDDESEEGVDDVLQTDSDDGVWSSCKANADVAFTLRTRSEDEDDSDEDGSDENGSDEDSVGESQRSSAPPDSPASSTGEEDWTESEDEEEERK